MTQVEHPPGPPAPARRMTLSSDRAAKFASAFDAMTQNIERAVLGKRHQVRLALTCLVADGHLLLEGYPGTGKTMLARSMARTLDAGHARIQFTPDLLPSDVTGVTVYDQHRGTFEFHAGPIFHNLVLADEINRASPKTQSALLEVMEEGHVTVDGKTYGVPRPFMVVATQNPIEQAGTYQLPEAQLDRFLMKVSLGYPDAEATEELLMGSTLRDRAELVGPIASPTLVGELRDAADDVYVDRALVGYVRRLCEASRELPSVKVGLSARAGLAFVRTARVWAAAAGRSHVVPDDVADLAHPILCHRLILTPEAGFAGTTVDDVIVELMAAVPAPVDRA